MLYHIGVEVISLIKLLPGPLHRYYGSYIALVCMIGTVCTYSISISLATCSLVGLVCDCSTEPHRHLRIIILLYLPSCRQRPEINSCTAKSFLDLLLM